jgi:hypothetical protein
MRNAGQSCRNERKQKREPAALEALDCKMHAQELLSSRRGEIFKSGWNSARKSESAVSHSRKLLFHETRFFYLLDHLLYLRDNSHRLHGRRHGVAAHEPSCETPSSIKRIQMQLYGYAAHLPRHAPRLVEPEEPLDAAWTARCFASK